MQRHQSDMIINRDMARLDPVAKHVYQVELVGLPLEEAVIFVAADGLELKNNTLTFVRSTEGFHGVEHDPVCTFAAGQWRVVIKMDPLGKEGA